MKSNTPKIVKGAKCEAVLKYLDRFFPHPFCSLCGNHGIIDTRGVKTPDGIEVGARNFCLCANGQAMRRAFETVENWDEHEIETRAASTPAASAGESAAENKTTASKAKK